MTITQISAKRRAVSLILKGIVIVAATVGTLLSALGGVGFMLGSIAFMYFTIQSNIAVALISAVGGILLLRKAPVKNAWFVVRFVGAVSITLTGAVFCFVLAPTLGDYAWQPQNVLTHLVVPIAAIADFFLTGIYGTIRKRHVVLVELPPLAYVIYAAVCYAAGLTFADGNCYPYFFLNWDSPAGAFGFTAAFPFLGCVWWILGLGAIILGIGFLYLLILDRLKQRASGRRGKDALPAEPSGAQQQGE